MRVAIVGCGLIGRKRALALSADDVLIACCDSNETLALKFAEEFKCSSFVDYKELFQNASFDAVIVAVVNKFALEIVQTALEKGLHVIAEKPLGRNERESAAIISNLDLARKRFGKFIVLKTGFNHRFHPGLFEAKEMLDNGTIGNVLSIRARYGHGGRAGMEKEWRASKELCGGGELLDQGVHIIDLCRWFAGDIKQVWGVAKTKFWEMEVEDNAFAHLESKAGADIQFNVSWTNWRNIFSFEVFGTNGYLTVNGLGGSYGTESLEVGIRKFEGGRPDITFKEYDAIDLSWQKEWQAFKNAIDNANEPIGNGYDGHAANVIISAIYSSSQKGAFVSL